MERFCVWTVEDVGLLGTFSAADADYDGVESADGEDDVETKAQSGEKNCHQN